jgi:hypothetical protein
MFHWIFNCREVTRRVSESLDRKLPLWQRVGIKIHFLMCKLCPEAKRQMLLIREAMGLLTLESSALDPEVSLSQETRERIKLALRQR